MRLLRWGRRLQLLAAVLLLVCAGLPWVRFPLLGYTMWLPGWVMNGGLVATLGLVVVILSLARVRLPGLYLVLGLMALAIIAMDGHVVATRTRYVLDRLQLQVSEKTSLLSRIGLTLPSLSPDRDWQPQDFVGLGLWSSAVADLLLLLGAGLEIQAYRKQFGVPGILLGRPACSGCGQRVTLHMAFCPGCGRGLAGDDVCRRCGAERRPGWQFCAGCGASASAGAVSPGPGVE